MKKLEVKISLDCPFKAMKSHQNLRETHIDISKKPQCTATFRDKGVEGLGIFHYRTTSHVQSIYFVWQKSLPNKIFLSYDSKTSIEPAKGSVTHSVKISRQCPF